MPEATKLKTKTDTKVSKENKKMPQIEIDVDLPTPKELVEAGAHWGHMKHRIFPKNARNIHGVRSNMHIINVYKTLEGLKAAIAFMKKTLAANKQILFIATKPSMKFLTKEYSEKIGQPYVNERWVGGTFTNYDFIEKSINKLKKIKSDIESGEIKKYPRHEQLMFKKELERLEVKFGGIQDMDRKSIGAVFIHDLKRDKIAFKEALQSKIPVISFIDTNINPKSIDYPIPCNDDSYEALKLIFEIFTKNLVS